jgi:hypothetical protein
VRPLVLEHPKGARRRLATKIKLSELTAPIFVSKSLAWKGLLGQLRRRSFYDPGERLESLCRLLLTQVSHTGQNDQRKLA